MDRATEKIFNEELDDSQQKAQKIPNINIWASVKEPGKSSQNFFDKIFIHENNRITRDYLVRKYNETDPVKVTRMPIYRAALIALVEYVEGYQISGSTADELAKKLRDEFETKHKSLWIQVELENLINSIADEETKQSFKEFLARKSRIDDGMPIIEDDPHSHRIRGMEKVIRGFFDAVNRHDFRIMQHYAVKDEHINDEEMNALGGFYLWSGMNLSYRMLRFLEESIIKVDKLYLFDFRISPAGDFYTGYCKASFHQKSLYQSSEELVKLKDLNLNVKDLSIAYDQAKSLIKRTEKFDKYISAKKYQYYLKDIFTNEFSTRMELKMFLDNNDYWLKQILPNTMTYEGYRHVELHTAFYKNRWHISAIYDLR